MNSVESIKDSLNLTRITATLHKDQYTFMIIPRSVLLRIRNISDKIVQKIKIHILYSITGVFPKIVPFMRYRGKILYSLAGHK